MFIFSNANTIDSLLQLRTVLVSTDLRFLDNQVLGVEVGWNVRDTDGCDKVSDQ